MSNLYLPHIADRVFGRPLLVTAARAQTIAAVLGGRVGIDAALHDKEEQQASRFQGRPSERGPYFVTGDGVAVIPIIGTLVNRGAWIGANSGLVSYEGLDAQIRAAAEDKEVRAILLDMDTPGGEAAGAFELPALIREVREYKPVVAFANDMAASAGYAIASAASEIVVTQTGEVGSIGVVMLHMDHSGLLESEGIIPTFIHAGARKVDGNPLEPLPEDVKSDLQTDVDRSYDLFINTVIAGRPHLTRGQIRATEARMYAGEQAVRAGLADRVDSFSSVLRGLNEKLSRNSPVQQRSKPMNEQVSEQMNEEDVKPDQKTDDDRMKAVEDHVRQAHDLGRSEGDKAARERIAVILDADEAKGRESLARKLAFSTELTPEAALAILEAAPKAAQGTLTHITEQAANLVSLDGSGSDIEPDDQERGKALAERYKTLRTR